MSPTVIHRGARKSRPSIATDSRCAAEVISGRFGPRHQTRRLTIEWTAKFQTSQGNRLVKILIDTYL
jgi:hypothetical protein